jgi:NTE family protein
MRPVLILGTSVGAFNGSVIADNPGPSGVGRLTAFWEEVSGADLFGGTLLGRMRSVATMRPAIHETSEIRSILERVHGPDRLIEDLTVPFQCVAASIERAAEHWFTRGPLVEAVLASSAVPALFPPVEIDGQHFYDGGLVNSVPLTRAVELGASVIFVLQVGRVETSLRTPKRLHEAALISFEIARRHRFTTTMEQLPEGVEVHLLPSGNPVSFDDRRQLRFSDTSPTPKLIEGAYRASRDYLGDIGLM